MLAADRYVAIFGDPEKYLGLTFPLDMAVLYVATARGRALLAHRHLPGREALRRP